MLSKIIVLLCVCFALSAASSDGLESLKRHADEARSILSTLPEECTTESHLITTEYVQSLYSIFNCSYSAIIDDAANVILETGAYAVMDYKTFSKLLVKFISCVAKINPIKIVECGFNSLVSIYDEIKDMVSSTENFLTDIKAMIPPLEHEIGNCLKLSDLEYKMFLNKMVHKARTCAKNL